MEVASRDSRFAFGRGECEANLVFKVLEVIGREFYKNV